MFSVSGDAREVGRDGLSDRCGTEDACDGVGRGESASADQRGICQDGDEDRSGNVTDSGEVTVVRNDVTVVTNSCGVDTRDSADGRLSNLHDPAGVDRAPKAKVVNLHDPVDVDGALKAKSVSGTTAVEDLIEAVANTRLLPSDAENSVCDASEAPKPGITDTSPAKSGDSAIANNSSERTSRSSNTSGSVAAAGDNNVRAESDGQGTQSAAKGASVGKGAAKSAEKTGPRWHAPPKSIFKKAAEVGGAIGCFYLLA